MKEHGSRCLLRGVGTLKRNWAEADAGCGWQNKAAKTVPSQPQEGIQSMVQWRIDTAGNSALAWSMPLPQAKITTNHPYRLR